MTRVDVVRDFGAIGDGVSDDSAAFQNAVAAVSAAGGGAIRIPNGRCLAVTANDAPIASVAGLPYFRLDGGGTLLIAPGSLASNFLHLEHIGRIEFRDVVFDGNSGRTSRPFEALRVSGTDSHLCLDGATIKNTYASSTFSGGDGVLLYQATGSLPIGSARISNCRFENIGRNGITVDSNMTDVTIVGNVFDRCGYLAVDVEADGVAIPGSCRVTIGSNTVTHGMGGFGLANLEGSSQTALMAITGNVIELLPDAIQGAIRVQNCACVSIVGNAIRNASRHSAIYAGIASESLYGCSDVTIQGNPIEQSRAGGLSPVHDAITVMSEHATLRPSGFTITGNRINYTGSTTIVGGIYLYHADDMTVVGNAVSDAPAQGIGTGDARRVLIATNQMRGCRDGVHLYPDSRYISVDHNFITGSVEYGFRANAAGLAHIWHDGNRIMDSGIADYAL